MVRQQESFVTLMQNYDRYRSLLETSEHSSGTAEIKYQSYRESYEAAQGELKATFQEFVNSSALNNILIDITHLMSKMVEFMEWLVKWGPALISQIIGFRAILGKSSFNKIIPKVTKDFKAGKDELTAFFKKFSKHSKAAQAQLDESATSASNNLDQVSDSAKSVEQANQAQSQATENSTNATQQNTTATENNNTATQQNTTAGQQNTVANTTDTQATQQNTQSKEQNTNATNQNTNAQQSSGTGGSVKGGKIGALSMGLSMISSGLMAAFTQMQTAATTHSYTDEYGKKTTVESSKAAQNAAKPTAAIGGMLSAIPIIGGILNTGLMHVPERIAKSIDENRDIANDAVNKANDILGQLNSIDSNLNDIYDSLDNLSELRTNARTLRLDLFNNENKGMLKIFEAYFGSSSKLLSVLDNIENATSREQALESYKQLQNAQLAAEKSQITAKHAAQLYNNEQTLQQAYNDYDQYSGYGAGSTWAGIGAGAATTAAGVGVGASVAGIALATGLINAWNPVGWALLITGAIAGAGAGITAGIAASNAVAEDNREQHFAETNFNLLSASEQIVVANSYVEDAIEREDYKLAEKAKALVAAAEAQNALTVEILNEINDLSAQQAFVNAKYGEMYLSEMSVAQLKNVGTTGIVEAFAKQLEGEEEEEGLQMYSLFIDGVLTDAGYEYALSRLRAQNDTEINSLLSGESYTLQEALRLNQVFDGNDRAIANVLKSFASALNLNVDELATSPQYQTLTLSEALGSTSELSEKISNLSSIFENITSSAGNMSSWMSTILSQFPELSIYMSDTSKLFSKLTTRLTDLGAAYMKSQYQEMASNSSVYSSLKGDFYTNLSSRNDLIQALDAAGNLTTIDAVIEYVAKNYADNGNITSDGQAILDALYKTMDDAKMRVYNQQLKALYDNYINFETQLLDTELENLNQQKQALSEINSQREYENRLIEAKLKLENASKDKKRIYRAGIGWVYEADQASIKTAQEELDNLQNEKLSSQLDEQISILESQKDTLSSIEEKMNFETMAAAFNSAFGKDFTFDNLVLAITAGIQGTSESASTESKGDAVQAAIAKSEAENNLRSAWSNLRSASTDYASNGGGVDKAKVYNTALEAYKTAASSAASAGVSNDTISGLDGTISHNGEILNALDATKAGNILSSGQFIIESYDGMFYTGTTKSQPSYDKKKHDYILSDIQNGEGEIILRNRKGIVAINDSRFAPATTDTTLEAYVVTLQQRGFNDYVLVGYSGDDEAVYVKNGQIFSIINDNGETGYISSHKAKELSKYGGSYLWDVSHNMLETAALGSLGLIGGSTLINELGTEAIITPNGTITALPSSTGIVPADITKNLWELGEVAPTLLRFMQNNILPDTIGSSSLSTATDESLNIGNLEMNVNADSSFDVDRFVDSIKARVALTRNTGR